MGAIPVAQIGYKQPPQPPIYPAASRARGEEGVATVLAWLKDAGTPAAIELANSSGFQRLDRAALQAAQGWQFNHPGTPTWVQIPVRFQLTEN